MVLVHGTPPFPDYVSGHSTFSGAASRVLAHFFKRNRTRFGVPPSVRYRIGKFLRRYRSALLAVALGVTAETTRMQQTGSA